MNIMRTEYPRPDFIRGEWMNLNGEWDFEIDNSLSGKDREFYLRSSLDKKINVPFCPESKLSGIENKDFMNCVWYRKDFDVPKEWKNKKIILHFGAADYHTYVYINGKLAGEHVGGYTPFSFDITEFLNEEGNYICVCCEDDVRSVNQPSGKQSTKYHSWHCSYTRTTGIWQSVWLEPLNSVNIDKIKTFADISTPSLNIEAVLKGDFCGAVLCVEAFWQGKSVGKKEVEISSQCTTLNLELSEKHLWEPGVGNLYDLKLEVKKDGEIFDSVDSYFGLRTVTLDGRAFKINGKTVFGRWVLDQGFYADGIYTAPKKEDLEADIIYSTQLGFNGARLHEKVFEPYFLYYADKHGYLVWDEHANWGMPTTKAEFLESFLSEWLEIVERDFNHPSVIGWCPFNETASLESNNNQKQDDMILKCVYYATKAIDKTRPVIDTSGHSHVVPEIYDVHNYEQDPAKLKAHYENVINGEIGDHWCVGTKYDGKMPVFVSEYGGTGWAIDKKGWSYGNAPKTEEEFIERYKGLTEALLHNKGIMGFCYTQLYDIEQEQNGLMTYDRKYKFDPEIFKKINSQKAAIEKEDEN